MHRVVCRDEQPDVLHATAAQAAAPRLERHRVEALARAVSAVGERRSPRCLRVRRRFGPQRRELPEERVALAADRQQTFQQQRVFCFS